MKTPPALLLSACLVLACTCPAAAAQPDVRLGELKPATSAKIAAGRNAAGGKLVMRGVAHEHGIGTRSGAKLAYALKPAYGTFVALVGIDDAAGEKGSIMAKVFIDGVLAGNSSYLTGGEDPWRAAVRIPAGAETLTIVIEDGKDGGTGDMADIAAAGFILRKNLPATGTESPKSKTDTDFFNGRNLDGWKGNMTYWSVRDGAIVGASSKKIPRNEFLFSDVPVGDFYLAVTVRQTPFGANSGIQFRSQVDRGGHAIGYQADMGKGWWGKLYHEHSGRRLLDTTGEGLKHVKPADWNRYEILAVGHRIWTAINGHVSVAVRDPIGELEGFIAVQLHSGGPQEVIFKDIELIHNPDITLAGKDEKQLDALLKPAAGTKKR